MSLSRRVIALVVVATVAAVLVTGVVGYGAVDGLSRLAQEQAAATLTRESELRVIDQARERAGVEHGLLDAVADAAQALAGYAGWLYERPGYFASPLEGGGELQATGEGHLTSEPGSPVGVLVPRVARPLSGIWQEVALLALVDPLLAGSVSSSGIAVRAWVVLASGAVRVYPNPGFGDPEVPVKPDYDPRDDWLYGLAANSLAAGRVGPVWSQPYAGAGDGTPVVAVVAPVPDGEGLLRAVVGLEAIVRLPADPVAALPEGGYALVVDELGRVIRAGGGALADLGLVAHDDDEQGDEAGWRPLSLDEAALPGPRQLAAALAGPDTVEGLRYEGAGGQRFAGVAHLGVTGWSLVWSVPAASLSPAASDIERQIDALRSRYGLGLLGAMLLIGFGLGLAGSLAGRQLVQPLATLTRDVGQLGDNLGHRVAETGPPEVAGLGREINRMARTVATAQEALVAAAAQAADDRRARLVAVLRERNRLAGEIHDTIAQDLAGVTIWLDNASELLATGERQRALTAIDRASELARQGLAGARRSVWSLRPRPLAQEGLVSALWELAAKHERDGRTIEVDLDEQVQLAAEIEDALYRVAEEALNNVFKHSGQTAAGLALTLVPGAVAGGGLHVELVVSDDGRGFDPAAQRSARPRDDGSGFGLWAMAERLAAVGGELAIESAPGRGAIVRGRVPAAAPGGKG